MEHGTGRVASRFCDAPKPTWGGKGRFGLWQRCNACWKFGQMRAYKLDKTHKNSKLQSPCCTSAGTLQTSSYEQHDYVKIFAPLRRHICLTTGCERAVDHRGPNDTKLSTKKTERWTPLCSESATLPVYPETVAP